MPALAVGINAHGEDCSEEDMCVREIERDGETGGTRGEEQGEPHVVSLSSLPSRRYRVVPLVRSISVDLGCYAPHIEFIVQSPLAEGKKEVLHQLQSGHCANCINNKYCATDHRVKKSSLEKHCALTRQNIALLQDNYLNPKKITPLSGIEFIQKCSVAIITVVCLLNKYDAPLY